MIRSRKSAEAALGVTIKPPFGLPANVVKMRSISVPLRASIGLTSTLNESAVFSMATTRFLQENLVGSRIIATRVTPGAICLSKSSHFPPMLGSNSIKPVKLPPGFSILAISLRLTGSLVPMKTIGIAGDCEDYAVVKYAALRELGVSPDDLRLVIVQDESGR
jgi:hypothetical protein